MFPIINFLCFTLGDDIFFSSPKHTLSEETSIFSPNVDFGKEIYFVAKKGFPKLIIFRHNVRRGNTFPAPKHSFREEIYFLCQKVFHIINYF